MDWNTLYRHCDKQGDCFVWSRRKTPQGYAATDREVTKKMLDAKSDILHIAVAMEHSDWREGLHALHSCGNPACVCSKHIRPGTRADNMVDRVLAGTQNTAKLTVDSVRQIRALKGARTRAQLAEQFNVSRSTIKKVLCNYTWRFV